MGKTSHKQRIPAMPGQMINFCSKAGWTGKIKGDKSGRTVVVATDHNNGTGDVLGINNTGTLEVLNGFPLIVIIFDPHNKQIEPLGDEYAPIPAKPVHTTPRT